jgi:hypothetical protein
MSEVPAVAIRCGATGCGRVLATIGPGGPQQHFPAADHEAWKDPQRVAWIEACPRHGGVPKGATLDDLDQRLAAKGLPRASRARIMRPIPWADLRAAYEYSLRTSRVAKYVLPTVGLD